MTGPSRTGRPWQRVKRRVIRRDADICHLCDRPGADTADHLVPVSRGGSLYEMANLKAAHHSPCNRLRGDRSISWARAEIARRWEELFGGPAPGQKDGGWTW